MWIAILCLLAICVATSTRQGRSEAREWIARHNAQLWLLAAIAWVPLLLILWDAYGD